MGKKNFFGGGKVTLKSAKRAIEFVQVQYENWE